jgi:hypothetical protein
MAQSTPLFVGLDVHKDSKTIGRMKGLSSRVTATGTAS